MKRLVALGGHAAESAADLAGKCDVLILLVVSAAQAEQVLIADGALEALGTGKPVVLMATCAPSAVAAIADEVEAAGRRFVDAPVSGGVPGIEAGTLTIMAAAPDDLFDELKPLLLEIGSNLYHLGTSPGQGAAMKTVNQLLAGVHIAAAAEGLALAERAGIDPELALKILGGSAAASWMLNNRGPRMVGDSDEVLSAVDIFVKDLGLVLDMGTSEKLGLPLSAAAHQLFIGASGMGLGKADDSQVIATYRRLAAPSS
jgi:putative dehydrogenase